MASLRARHSKRCTLKGKADARTQARGREDRRLHLQADLLDSRPGGGRGHERLGQPQESPGSASAAPQGATTTEAASRRALRTIRFEAWADEWLKGLRRPTENTRRSYRATLEYGKRAFGHKPVRSLTTTDVPAFLDLMPKASPVDRRRGTCASCTPASGAAVRKGVRAPEPGRAARPAERPRPIAPPPVYFTDAELVALWRSFEQDSYLADVWAKHKRLEQLAVTTGCRQGELLALRWCDWKPLDKELGSSRSYVAGIGFQTLTKNRQAPDRRPHPGGPGGARSVARRIGRGYARGDADLPRRRRRERADERFVGYPRPQERHEAGRYPRTGRARPRPQLPSLSATRLRG